MQSLERSNYYSKHGCYFKISAAMGIEVALQNNPQPQIAGLLNKDTTQFATNSLQPTQPPMDIPLPPTDPPPCPPHTALHHMHDYYKQTKIMTVGSYDLGSTTSIDPVIQASSQNVAHVSPCGNQKPCNIVTRPLANVGCCIRGLGEMLVHGPTQQAGPIPATLHASPYPTGMPLHM